MSQTLAFLPYHLRFTSFLFFLKNNLLDLPVSTFSTKVRFWIEKSSVARRICHSRRSSKTHRIAYACDKSKEESIEFQSWMQTTFNLQKGSFFIY
jgi:hypothetical protein